MHTIGRHKELAPMNRSRAIFLDFDGVLHGVSEATIDPNRVPSSSAFRYLPLLANELIGFCDVGIVVSSSWNVLFSLGELRSLLGPLSDMVVGSTREIELQMTLQILSATKDNNNQPGIYNRYRICESYAKQNGYRDWVILDDSNTTFLQAESSNVEQRSRVILCDSEMGLSTPGVIDTLKSWLVDSDVIGIS